MYYPKLVQEILTVGESLLKCGAETYRIEDSLLRMLTSYGFRQANIFVIPSNIQISVETPQGDVITQIRHIKYRSTDFHRLDRFNDLSRYICKYLPDEGEIHRRTQDILSEKPEHPLIKYMAKLLGGTGFAIFYGASGLDIPVAIFASLVITATGVWLERHEKNLFTYNLFVSFFAEVVILGCAFAGIGTHPDRVMIGCIMVLISGLGLTNGIRDLLLCDFISGLLNIMNAFLGAAGIAIGVALALLLMNGDSAGNVVMNTSIPIQLLSCTVACVGFAYMFKIRGKQIVYAGIGSFLTWAIYACIYQYSYNSLFATIFSSIFVGVYAFFAARINKAPSTIFLTAAVIPLLPGAHLYSLMDAYIMKKDTYATYQASRALLETSIAIAFGFLLVDVFLRIFFHLNKKEGNRKEKRF